jgi:hypothetical protein
MAEHFIARMRGLWLSYPDGSVVTARPPGRDDVQPAAPIRSELAESNPPVTDPAVRRASLAAADRSFGVRSLVRAHAPEDGRRPDQPAGPLSRTDCGWVV